MKSRLLTVELHGGLHDGAYLQTTSPPGLPPQWIDHDGARYEDTGRTKTIGKHTVRVYRLHRPA